MGTNSGMVSVGATRAALTGGGGGEARRRLAIVGSAGRGADAGRMTPAVFARMVDAGRAVVRARGFSALVSGGAAGADHVAVALALEGAVDPRDLLLCVPAAFVGGRYDGRSADGRTCNHHHDAFARCSGRDGLAELARVLATGAAAVVNPAGFKARNGDVARAGTELLAMTFGTGDPWRVRLHGPGVTAAQAGLNPAGTGTVDTWGKSRAAARFHVTLADLP